MLALRLLTNWAHSWFINFILIILIFVLMKIKIEKNNFDLWKKNKTGISPSTTWTLQELPGLSCLSARKPQGSQIPTLVAFVTPPKKSPSILCQYPKPPRFKGRGHRYRASGKHAKVPLWAMCGWCASTRFWCVACFVTFPWWKVTAPTWTASLTESHRQSWNPFPQAP